MLLEKILPLLVVLVLGMLLKYVSGAELMMVVLGSSLPASLMTVVFAREHQLDTRFLVSMFSLAFPTAIGIGLLLVAFVPH